MILNITYNGDRLKFGNNAISWIEKEPIYYYQNFDEETFPPDEYENNAIIGSGVWERIPSSVNPNVSSPYDGSSFIRYRSYDYVNGNSAVLITPKFYIPPLHKIIITMFRDLGYESVADRIEILVSDDTSLTNTILIATINRSYNLNPPVTQYSDFPANWYKHYYDIPYGEWHIVLKSISGYGNNIYIDNFSVVNKPVLKSNELSFKPTPSNETSQNILKIYNFGIDILEINEDGISISGDDSSYFNISTQSFPIQITNEMDDFADLLINFSPITEKKYSAILNINHNGINSPTQIPISADGYDPFDNLIETFDTAIVPNMPIFWTKYIGPSAALIKIVTENSGDLVTPPIRLQMNNSNDTNANIMLITPALFISNHEFKFYAKSSPGYTINIGMVLSPNDPESFTLISGITLTSSWVEYTIPFTDYAGIIGYIALKHGLGGMFRAIYIDNITYQPII